METKPLVRVPTAVRAVTTYAAFLALVGPAASGCAVIDESARSTPVDNTTKPTVASPRTEPISSPRVPPVTDEIPPAGPSWLELDDRGDLGTVVVDGTGRTVYAFGNDRPNDPTCYGTCAATWLPVLATGDPAGGIGIDVAAARTVDRRDGGTQVTYRGKPLYHYAGDTAPRAATGQGLTQYGGDWYVLGKDGEPLN